MTVRSLVQLQWFQLRYFCYFENSVFKTISRGKKHRSIRGRGSIAINWSFLHRDKWQKNDFKRDFTNTEWPKTGGDTRKQKKTTQNRFGKE